MLIGIDFDNTVAGYDRLFTASAEELGLLESCATSKQGVRDALRAKGEAGEGQWQRLQALVYGQRMAEAELIKGVDVFLERCRAAHIPVRIVSHKTRHSPVDETGTDHCAVALRWMENKGFFTESGLGLRPEQVYFEPTRQAKVARISTLGCSHFIDDLPEVFEEPGFPSDVKAILFAPQQDSTSEQGGWIRFRDWDGISDYVFASRAHA